MCLCEDYNQTFCFRFMNYRDSSHIYLIVYTSTYTILSCVYSFILNGTKLRNSVFISIHKFHITYIIQALKVIRRNKEDIWRKNPIVINFQIYQESCLAVKNAINESKTKVIQKKIVDSKGDQKQLFKIVETLLGRTKEIVLPEYQDPASLASRLNIFFYG